MELTITDLQNLLEHKDWKAIVQDYKKQAEDAKSQVLLDYLEGTEDQSIYNFKHVAVEQLKIALELREKMENIELPASQEFVKFVDIIIKDYENRIKGQLVADAMVYFTKTDIEIRKANTKTEFIAWLDHEIEKLKNPKKEDNVMDRIREE